MTSLANLLPSADEDGTTRPSSGVEPDAHHHVVGTQTPIGTGAEEYVRRRGGRPKRMELESLVASTQTYLSELTGYNPATVKDMGRRLRNICKDLWALRKAPGGRPRIVTTDPRQLSVDDLRVVLQYWKTKGLKSSYQVKLVEALEGFLVWHGNPALTSMRKMKTIRFPKIVREDIVFPNEDEMEILRATANAIDGWEGSVACLIVGLLPNCGLRPTEFRTQRKDGVDTRTWRIRVTHPKGEGVYASSGAVAPITAPGRQVVLDFFAERETYLKGERHEAFIPWRSPDGSVDFIGQRTLVNIKKVLQDRSGVPFRLKDFRAMFIQTHIDLGVRTEAVSRAARHSTTRTTETFYGRIRTDKAFVELDAAYPVVKPVG